MDQAYRQDLQQAVQDQLVVLGYQVLPKLRALLGYQSRLTKSTLNWVLLR